MQVLILRTLVVKGVEGLDYLALTALDDAEGGMVDDVVPRQLLQDFDFVRDLLRDAQQDPITVVVQLNCRDIPGYEI